MCKVIKNWMEIDGVKYYHYSLGVKSNSTKSVVIDGISFYNSNSPIKEDLLETEWRLVS